MSEKFNLNNRYQFMGMIGKGRMGDVYRASDNFFRREVALKMIRKETASPEFLQYFSTRYAQYITMLAKLNNPSIIKTYDFTSLNGVPAWTMDLYSGASYAQYTGKQMTVEQAANLLIPVADALTYAHNYGMFHGNLKPSNILIDNNQNPVLTDFGLTQWLSENGHGYGQFEANAGIGSPEYLSPEQAQGGMMDARSDVYSLGIMFYELVTGRRPFAAISPLETMARQVSDQIQSPRNFAPNISQQAEQFIYQATAKNPAQRISSMSEAAMILRSLSTPSAAGAYYPPASYYNQNVPNEDEDDDDGSFREKFGAAVGTFRKNKNAKYIAIALGVLVLAGIVIAIVAGNNRKIQEMNAASTQQAIQQVETQNAVLANVEKLHQQTAAAEEEFARQTQIAEKDAAAAAALAATPTPEPFMIPTIPAASIPTAVAQSTGRFQSQTPVDGANFIKGEAFNVVWTIENTGTTDWTDSFKIKFDGGTNFTVGNITEKYIGTYIWPNGASGITLPCIAPQMNGTYSMVWHIEDENGNEIPNISLSITINAIDGVLTPTPLPEGAITPTWTSIPDDGNFYVADGQ